MIVVVNTYVSSRLWGPRLVKHSTQYPTRGSVLLYRLSQLRVLVFGIACIGELIAGGTLSVLSACGVVWA